MDAMSGSAEAELFKLCRDHGLRDAALGYHEIGICLFATTGYLADGSPIVTLITHGEDIHEVRQNVNALLWAWGRK